MYLDTASVEANIGKNSARRYYRQYLQDPNHKVPVPPKMGQYNTSCTQEQINELLRYIVNDKMSIENAAIKAVMSVYSARRYYNRHLHYPDHKIPTAQRNSGTRFTELVGYIVNDKMSINTASAKLNMGGETAKNTMTDI